MERSLGLDMCDSYVDVASTLLEISHSLLGLLEKDMMKQLAKQKEVNLLRDALKKGGDDELITLVATSVQQSGTWKQRLESYVQSVANKAIHSERLAFTENVISGLDNNDTGTGVAQAVQDLQFLSDQLGNSVGDYVESTKSKLMAYVAWAVEELSLKRWQGTPECVQNVLMEISLLWPMETRLQEHSEKLAGVLSSQSAQAKWDELAATLEALEQCMQHNEDTCTAISEALRATEQCKTMMPGPELQHSLLLSWVSVREKIARKIEQGDLENIHELPLLSAWQSWVSKQECESLDLLRSYKDVNAQMLAFIDQKESVEKIAVGSSPEGTEAVKELIRVVKKGDETLKQKAGGMASLVDALKGSLRKAKAQVNDCKKMVLSKLEAALLQHVEAAEPVAKGGSSGESWCSGLSASADWSEMVTAGETLMQSKPPMFNEPRVALEKAPPGHRGWAAQGQQWRL